MSHPEDLSGGHIMRSHEHSQIFMKLQMERGGEWSNHEESQRVTSTHNQ